MKTSRLILLIAALAVAAAACGSAGTAADEPGSSPLPPAGADTTCLAGDPDCGDLGPADQPIMPGEPTGDAPDGPATPLDGGGLSVADVLAHDIDGGFAVQGFLVDDGSGPVLCDALAELFPPQCGGDSIPLELGPVADLAGLTASNGVTWSEEPLVIVGEVVDGVFVATPVGS